MRKTLGLTLLLLSLSGCGSSADTAGGVDLPAASPPAATAVSANTIFGRVQTDRPLDSASVTFLRPDNSALPGVGPVVTDESGTFITELPVEVRDFRAVARRGDEVYAADYRNFQRAQEMVVISPLTNLVSAYQEAHPDLPLERCEAVVRSFLRLPATHDVRLDMVSSHRPGFHVGRYLQQARQGGPGFVDRLVAQMDNSVQAPVVDNALFADNQAIFWENQSAQLAVAVVQTFASLAEIPGSSLVGWGVTLLLAEAEGNPHAAEFAALAAEIQALAQEVVNAFSELQLNIARGTYTDAVTVARQRLESIPATQTIYLTALGKQKMTPQEQQDFAARATAPSFLAVLATAHDALLGAPGVPGLIGLRIELMPLFGYFYRNSDNSDPLVSLFRYFADQQATAIGLIVEGFHAQPAPDLASAREWYDRFRFNLALQATAVPEPLSSDEVVLVRNAGLLFVNRAFGRNTFQQAIGVAQRYRTGGYGGFRVATSSDILALQAGPPGQPGVTLDQVASVIDLHRPINDPDHGSRHYLGLGDDIASAMTPGDINAARVEAATRLRRPWGDDHYYFLLCASVKDQPLSQLPTLAGLSSLRVNSLDPTHVQALGRFNYPQITPLPFQRGAEPAYELGRITSEELDVTDLVAWSDSNEGTLRIQNPPALALPSPSPRSSPFPSPAPSPLAAGTLTWLRTGSTTVTAQTAEGLNATLAVSNTSLTPQVLRGVLLAPRNVLLKTVPSVTNISVTGVYTDGNARPLRNATFTTSIPQARVVDLAGRYQLDLSSRPPTTSFNVTATVDGKSDTTTFYVIP